MAASPPQIPCASCRSPLPLGARFCNACGAQQPEYVPPVAQPAPRGPSLAQTQYVAQPAAFPQAPQQPPPAQPQAVGYAPQPHQPPSSSPMQIAPPPPSSRPSAGKLGAQTVLGVASPMSNRSPQPQAPHAPAFVPPPQYQPPPNHPPQAAPQAPGGSEPPKYARASHPGFAPAPPPPGQGTPAPTRKQQLGATMIGVGILPGVGAPAPTPPTGVGVPPGAAGLAKNTMLGVALPGIAPTHQHVPAQQQGYQQQGYPQPQQAHPAHPPQGYPQQGYPPQQYAAPPNERVSMPPESALPVTKPSRVVPIVLVLVALIAVAVTLVLVLRPSGPPPLTSAIEGDTNAPKLVVKCGSCADGSAIDLGNKNATFTGGSASIALASADLKAGRNVFRGKVTPKDKKPQDVELEVLIPYLVHPSLAPLAKGESKVDVVFDLADDVKSVEVDGAKLEGAGEQTHSIEIPAPAEDARVFDKTVSYTVQQKSGPTIKGSLKLAIPYATLRIGLPGRRPFVIGDDLEVTGKTGAGATVVVGDAKLTADDAGVFKGKAKVGKDDKELKLRAFGAKLAPREVVVPLSHAASFDEVAKLLRAEAKTPFDKVAEKPDDHVGKVVATKLEVQQVGEEDGRVVAIGETRCPTASESKCPAVKVLVPPGSSVAKGDVIEVLGVVVGKVSSEKTKATAVEVDASWVAKK